MAYTFVALAGGFADGAGTTVDCSSSLNVQAGDLLVAWAKWEGSDTTTAVAKNSGSPPNAFTFDAGDHRFNVSGYGAGLGYVLAADADATATFRFTCTSNTFRKVFVAQFRPAAGNRSIKDGSAINDGTSTAPNSGNISTTGSSGVAVGAYGENSPDTTSSEQINGSAATEPAGSPLNGTGSLWYSILSAAFSGGAASATLGGTDNWLCGIIAFKEVPPSGRKDPTTRPRPFKPGIAR